MTCQQTTGVLVVIPCLNEARHLPALIEGLCADSPDQRIVVADGGSTDGSQSIIEALSRDRPGLVLMANADRLQSAGVNAAVERYGLGHRYLVRVDAHAEYPEGFVRRLVQAAEATGADSVVTPMKTVGATCFQKAVAAAQNSRLGNGGSPHRAGGRNGWVDHGHHGLMRLSSFAALGGYDPTYSHNEDAEYDIRLVRQGGRIWMQADLAIRYAPRDTPLALFRQYSNYGRGRARSARLHAARLKPRQAAPALVAPLALVGAVAVPLGQASPWFWLAACPLFVWMGLCIVAGLVGSGTSPSICARAAGAPAMIMHLAWSIGFWRQSLSSSWAISRPPPDPGPAVSLSPVQAIGRSGTPSRPGR